MSHSEEGGGGGYRDNQTIAIPDAVAVPPAAMSYRRGVWCRGVIPMRKARQDVHRPHIVQRMYMSAIALQREEAKEDACLYSIITCKTAPPTPSTHRHRAAADVQRRAVVQRIAVEVAV